jgi:hypothetical protein
MKSDKDTKKTSESQRARRFWRGHFRSDNVKLRKRKVPRWRTAKRKTLKDLARIELLLDSGSSARDSPA